MKAPKHRRLGAFAFLFYGARFLVFCCYVAIVIPNVVARQKFCIHHIHKKCMDCCPIAAQIP